MYANDTSILNIGKDINELQSTTSETTCFIKQYFETNNLSVNSTKTHYISSKQSNESSELKILIKNRDTVNVKSTNFLGVIIDSNLSWEVHIERTCSRISHNLFKINRLSKILDMNVRRMMYYGFI
jgi:methionine aminopeptidase